MMHAQDVMHGECDALALSAFSIGVLVHQRAWKDVRPVIFWVTVLNEIVVLTLSRWMHSWSQCAMESVAPNHDPEKGVI